MTSQWARWRLKSPASPLFTQPFIHIKENIKAARHWPLWGGIHRGLVHSPHKCPVTWKMFPFDDVIMKFEPRLDVKTVFRGIGIPIMKIRRS